MDNVKETNIKVMEERLMLIIEKFKSDDSELSRYEVSKLLEEYTREICNLARIL